MATGNYRRRSTSNRAQMMPDKQLHAIGYHLQLLFEGDGLSTQQEAFLKVVVAELEHRFEVAHWTEKCRCRLCVPSAPMSGR